jgi:hypothetical protein
VGSRANTGSSTHADTDVALAVETRLGRVNSDSHPHNSCFWERALSGYRRCGGIGSAVEHSKERITFGVYDGSIVGSDRVTQTPAMLSPQIAVGQAVLPRQVGRPLDVAEEKGDRSSRKINRHAWDRKQLRTAGRRSGDIPAHWPKRPVSTYPVRSEVATTSPESLYAVICSTFTPFGSEPRK